MGRIIKTLFVLSLLLILVVAQDEGYEWGNADWVNQQDFNSYNMQDLIAGIEQNPNLLNDPKFFTAFENKLSTDTSVLDNNPKVLTQLGNKIGMDFSTGSGISSYARGPNGLNVLTKGCGDCDPSYAINLLPEKLKAQGSEVIVNSDGSVEIKSKNKKSFSAQNGIIDTKGNNIIIQSGTIIDGGRELTIPPGFSATTSGDGIYVSNSLTLTGADGEKMWLVGEENFQLDLRDPEKPKLSMLGTKEIIVGKVSEPAEAVTLKSGAVVLESSTKYLFDKDSQFTITRGKSVSTFSADNNLKFCFGGCYGANSFLPKNYEKGGVSTIELLEDYEVSGQQRVRNILKLTSVNADNIEVDLLYPAYSFIYPSVHSSSKGIGHINIQQRGVYGLGEPFYSKTKIDNTGTTIAYGKNPETGEAYLLGGSPIVVNRPFEKSNNMQDVQLVFLSNDAYDSENPIYDKDEIDLFTFFLEDQDIIEGEVLDVGRLTSKNPVPEVKLTPMYQDYYLFHIQKIDEAKKLRDRGLIEEANKLLDSWDGPKFPFYEYEEHNSWQPGDTTGLFRKQKANRKIAEYAIASGFTEHESIYGAVRYGLDDEDFHADRKTYSLEDIDNINRFMPYVDQEKITNDLIYKVQGMRVALYHGMSQEEYYAKFVEPFTYLNEEQKAIFHPDNRGQLYENYDALAYQIYCVNPSVEGYCSSDDNQYAYLLNSFVREWEE